MLFVLEGRAFASGARDNNSVGTVIEQEVHKGYGRPIVDAAVRVQLGEEVVTAGLELKNGLRSPYPKGLLIGQVVDVTRDANEVVQTAFVQPAANLDRLEYVLVIVDYIGGLPTNDQAPAECAPSTGGTLTDQEQPCFTTPASPSPRITTRPTRTPVPTR